MVRTTPFLGCSGNSSIGSVSVSESKASDSLPPLGPGFRRWVAWPSLATRALDRFSAPRLRESSESSATIELCDTGSISSFVRSIDLSKGPCLERLEGPGIGVS